MKKYLFVLTLIISISAYSQSLFTEISKQTIDGNGIPFNSNSKLLNVYDPGSNFLTSYAYDTVRALTEINLSNGADAYPWISPDGLRLYYTSEIAGINQLMFTNRPTTSDYFISPSIIPISVSDPYSFWFSIDELDVYICTSNEIYFAHRASTTSQFNSPSLINLIGGPAHSSVKGASLNSSQNVLFVSLYDVTFTTSVIAEFSRTSSDTFTYVRTLPAPTGNNTNPGQLSKDALTFFFSAEINMGHYSLCQLTRPTPSDSFLLGSFQLIQGINDSSILYNLQPTMSENLNWVVFVRNFTGSWSSDDLYIAYSTSTGILNLNKINSSVSVFPNPSSGIFHIEINNIDGNMNDGIIEVYNTIGENILHQKFINEIDISNYPKGIYLIQVKFKDEIYLKKIVLE